MFAALGDEAEGGREEVVEGGFVADGGVADEAPGVGHGGEVGSGVPEKADVEGCGLGEGEGGREAGFDFAGSGGLAHDGEGAQVGELGMGVGGVEDVVGHSGF